MFWPLTVSEYYNNAVYWLKKSNTCVYDYDFFCSNVYSLLKTYLKESKNSSILIKTSVTGKRGKDHEVNALLLENILAATRGICPNSKITLADGPAYVKSFRTECNKLGWDKITAKYNVKIFDFNYDECYFIFNRWPVAYSWFNADKIINICKAKTHRRFGVTLSLKNLLGVFSGRVLGFPKFSYKHEYVPRLLYELDSISTERINIIDGYRGIEGQGPMHGRPTKSNFVVIGSDSYSCDFQATIEMGFAPAVTLTNIRPFNFNLGFQMDLDYLDILSLRKSKVDFYPNISCSWMYGSLNKDFRSLQRNYEILLGGIEKCWSKGI